MDNFAVADKKKKNRTKKETQLQLRPWAYDLAL